MSLGFLCLFLLTLPEFAFSAAIVVRNNLNFDGNGIVVDSFDSSNPALSTDGQYDPTKAGDGGDIYVGQTYSNSEYIGNALVYGTLIAGPGVPVSLGPAGAIGTHAWIDSGGTGIEPGFFFNDANFPLPDIAVPSGPFLVPAPGSVATQTGPATNQTFIDQTNLPTLGPGQSFTSITTNISTVTTNDYPGPIPGLVTNTIITPPCITPITNTACGNEWITSATAPDSWCAANGIITNCTLFTDSSTLPSPGSLCPGSEIVTNSVPHHLYTYSLITGYTYTTNTTNEIITYSTNYDCPSTTNYTYSYPQVDSYDYTIYSAWTYQTNSYDDVLSGGNYSATSLGNTIVTGPSTLVLASGFPISLLTIAPGGSLTVYVQSGFCSISINQVTNETGLASNLLILCSPGVTALTLSGTGSFLAVLDAPEADASVSSGANSGMNFSGTLLVNALIVNGHFGMHYDEALGQGGYLPFLIVPWPATLAPNVSTNGLFQLYVDGTPGVNCAVETSTDLINWVPVFTNVAPFTFTDTNGMGLPQNFYRTIYVQ